MANVNENLAAVLINLRGAVGPLVEDLQNGVEPSLERWLEFANVLTRVVETCRQHVTTGASTRRAPEQRS
jgi:hypothetical protein